MVVANDATVKGGTYYPISVRKPMLLEPSKLHMRIGSLVFI